MRSVCFTTFLCAATAFGGSITQYSNRGLFDAAVGPTTLEDFTSSHHYPITTGSLNSTSNIPAAGITPGMIQPGVTYSAPVEGSGSDFNIDAGASYAGGFLDTILNDGATTRPITITFDGPVAAFGFDTSDLGGNTKSIQINFTSGSPFTTTLNTAGGFHFFGFQSSTQDIQSVVLQYVNPGTFGAALDNFSFTAMADPSDVPEPATFALAGSALALLAAVRRR